jgi:SagB-type dehydrogenase family enzyme
VETATQLLHRLTALTEPWWERERSLPDGGWTPPVDDPRVVRDLVANDPARFPWSTKRYPPDLPRVELPRDTEAVATPAMDVLAGTATTPPRPLDLGQLARILHLSAGVVRTAKGMYGTYLFRAAGSAGGRFPLELYVAVPEGDGRLPPGVHWFDPVAHALVRVAAPPAGPAATTIVVTGVPWRSAWRYRERAFRHVYWDAGTMLSQLLAAAASAGLAPRLYSTFPDAPVAALVGADGVHEWPVAVVALGGGDPATAGGADAASAPVDASPAELPLITRAQHAGDRQALGEPWPPAAPAALTGMPPAETLDALALRRGSQRRMVIGGRVDRRVLDDAMAVAMRGIGLAHDVVVHRVDGAKPGRSRWPALDAPVVEADLHDAAYWVCVEQELCREAAYVVVASADVATLDDREYRAATLAAGIVEGRLHLAAYALGASATGMTFLDDAGRRLLGGDRDPLLLTCVGVPEYTSRAGGPPGRPTSIRMITPRGE